MRDARRWCAATSPPKRSRACSISPRSTSDRISIASRESSETGGRRPFGAAAGVTAVSAATAGRTSLEIRTSEPISPYDSGKNAVYSLQHCAILLTWADPGEYDPRILRMLLALHALVSGLGIGNE